MTKRLIAGTAAAYAVILMIMTSLQHRSEAKPWYEKYSTICHALGRTLEGDFLSNSKEAFLINYWRGQRVFETDLSITSDGILVLRHDWNTDLGQAEVFGEDFGREGDTPVTAAEFMSAPVWGKYTPMTLKDWFVIMKSHPDIYMVTDTKFYSDIEERFGLFVGTAVENGYEDVLSRVIVQIYYEDMYDEVSSVYPFENWIWTLYRIGYPGGNEVLDFMRRKDIPVLTMPSDGWSSQIGRELEGSGIKVYVHTVNDEEEARLRISQGVSGIYTDDIYPLFHSAIKPTP